MTQGNKNFGTANDSSTTQDPPTRGFQPGLWTETRFGGPRVVFLHGFTQAGKSWDPVLQLCGDLEAEVLLPDLPGHGRSSHIAIDLNATADLLAASYGPAFYVGYSMGGRLALHVALRHPGSVRGLLLFGATAGLQTEQERKNRLSSDEILAQDLETIGVPAFLERWLAGPLFATLPYNSADLQLRTQNTVGGLASSLRLSGTGSQSSLWDLLGTIRVPTILAAGDRDEKFTSIGRAMVNKIGSTARFAEVTNAGHACHLEQPHRATELLRQLLLTRPAD
jgi:2-succinyl-6-hydroxy-2,4-cyclohexadiene-1-carboxylate synthase